MSRENYRPPIDQKASQTAGTELVRQVEHNDQNPERSKERERKELFLLLAAEYEEVLLSFERDIDKDISALPKIGKKKVAHITPEMERLIDLEHIKKAIGFLVGMVKTVAADIRSYPELVSRYYGDLHRYSANRLSGGVTEGIGSMPLQADLGNAFLEIIRSCATAEEVRVSGMSNLSQGIPSIIQGLTWLRQASGVSLAPDSNLDQHLTIFGLEKIPEYLSERRWREMNERWGFNVDDEVTMRVRREAYRKTRAR